MYKLVLELPFDVVIASRQDYETEKLAIKELKRKNLPDGFKAKKIEDVPETAILLPLGK